MYRTGNRRLAEMKWKIFLRVNLITIFYSPTVLTIDRSPVFIVPQTGQVLHIYHIL